MTLMLLQTHNDLKNAYYNFNDDCYVYGINFDTKKWVINKVKSIQRYPSNNYLLSTNTTQVVANEDSTMVLITNLCISFNYLSLTYLKNLKVKDAMPLLPIVAAGDSIDSVNGVLTTKIAFFRDMIRMVRPYSEIAYYVVIDPQYSVNSTYVINNIVFNS